MYQLKCHHYRNSHYVSALDEFLGHSHLYLRLRRGYAPEFLTLEATKPQEAQEVYHQLAVMQYYYNLTSIVDLSRRIGAEPVLVTQARLPHESNTEEEQEKIHYDFVGLAADSLVNAFNDCDSEMNRLATEEDVLLIDEPSIMNGNLEYFVDHVHTTPAGSVQLGEIVAEAFYRKVLDQ